jgi:hypothetical protein
MAYSFAGSFVDNLLSRPHRVFDALRRVTMESNAPSKAERIGVAAGGNRTRFP